MAERVGFEPTVRINRTTDFESAAFDHSAISPYIHQVATASQSVVKNILFSTDLSASRSIT